MKLKNWKDNTNYVRTFMKKSFQRVYYFTWVLLNKWESVVVMKNVLIWHAIKKEERRAIMIQMSNDKNES